jgi:hypothetical protein
MINDTHNDAARALTILLKHLFQEFQEKGLLSPLERKRMLDAVQHDIVEALDDADRFHAVFEVIGDLWH